MRKLSVRARNALLYAFEERFEVDEKSRDHALKVSSLSKTELLRTPNLGKVSVFEIELWLEGFGLQLDRTYFEEQRARLEARERAELARLKDKYEVQR